MFVSDTIAAISTAPGYGGIGIVRASGPLAPSLARRVTAGGPAGPWTPRQLHHVRFLAPDGSVIDEGLAVLFPAPRSATGEDVLELQGHGSPVALRSVLAHLLAAGARLAEPGEFTRRAFLNGRLDLTQAEAVADLIHARSRAAAARAATQLEGRLSRSILAWRTSLIELKALLEVQIDFSEEEVHVPPQELFDRLAHLQDALAALAATAAWGALERQGARVTLVGKPNVGKSSLLNALLGRDRAIVTEVAGTTRDTLEEGTEFEGLAVVLTDTAGIRPLDEADPVERLGMARTEAALTEAELRLAIFDPSRPWTEEDEGVLARVHEAPHLLVLNQSDRPACWGAEELTRRGATAPIVSVSAVTLAGLDELRRQATVRLRESVTEPPADSPVLTNLRQLTAVEATCQALGRAEDSLRQGLPPDIVAVDAQDALDHLGTITGAVDVEDVLDVLFSRFCLGK